MPVIGASQDAFGLALLDYHEGRPGPSLVLERDDGSSGPALQPAEFFAAHEAWPDWEQRVVRFAIGSILDLGAGAGRHSLHLQGLGHEVTAVDWSPGAAQVCRSRGIRDVRSSDIAELKADREWDTSLLMCGNLGLAGGWEETRELLKWLARATRPGGVLIADSVDPEDPEDLAYQERNRRAGFHRGRVRLRLRYGDVVTPWWEQINLPAADIPALAAGTGWTVELQLEDGEDHAVVLRRRPDATAPRGSGGSQLDADVR